MRKARWIDTIECSDLQTDEYVAFTGKDYFKIIKGWIDERGLRNTQKGHAKELAIMLAEAMPTKFPQVFPEDLKQIIIDSSIEDYMVQPLRYMGEFWSLRYAAIAIRTYLDYYDRQIAEIHLLLREVYEAEAEANRQKNMKANAYYMMCDSLVKSINRAKEDKLVQDFGGLMFGYLKYCGVDFSEYEDAASEFANEEARKSKSKLHRPDNKILPMDSILDGSFGRKGRARNYMLTEYFKTIEFKDLEQHIGEKSYAEYCDWVESA